MPVIRVARAMSRLSRELGTPVAPHVAGRLVGMQPRGLADLLALSRGLSAAQLAGLEMIPDPLPAVFDAAWPDREREPTGALGDALLIAALSRTDRLDVLLTAIDADIAALVEAGLGDHVAIRDGRFAFRRPVLRSVLVGAASPVVLAHAHDALADALEMHEDPRPAVWHRLHGVRGERVSSVELLDLAEHLLAAGAVHGAFQVARAAVDRPGAPRWRAVLLAGRAALAAGALVDAERSFSTAMRRASGPEPRRRALEMLEAGRRLREGAGDAADPLQQIADQADVLLAAAVTDTDRMTAAGIVEITGSWHRNMTEADLMFTRLHLSAIGARGPWPWNVSPGALSPLIDAFLHGHRSGRMLHSGDIEAAAQLLTEALISLPMSHVGGGITVNDARIIAARSSSFRVEFVDALAALAPPRTAAIPPPFAGDRERISSADGTDADLSALTPREREVMDLLADGCRNREIARRLEISERTVEVHLGRIYPKMRVRSRAQLIARMLA